MQKSSLVGLPQAGPSRVKRASMSWGTGVSRDHVVVVAQFGGIGYSLLEKGIPNRKREKSRIKYQVELV